MTEEERQTDQREAQRGGSAAAQRFEAARGHHQIDDEPIDEHAIEGMDLGIGIEKEGGQGSRQDCRDIGGQNGASRQAQPPPRPRTADEPSEHQGRQQVERVIARERIDEEQEIAVATAGCSRKVDVRGVDPQQDQINQREIGEPYTAPVGMFVQGVPLHRQTRKGFWIVASRKMPHCAILACAGGCIDRIRPPRRRRVLTATASPRMRRAASEPRASYPMNG